MGSGEGIRNKRGKSRAQKRKVIKVRGEGGERPETPLNKSELSSNLSVSRLLFIGR